MIRICLTLLAAALLLPAPASAEQLRWSGVEHVVAFADVHGAYDELVMLLRRTGVIDENNAWSGGNTHVVSTGDLVDRGADSRKVMDLLMRLQSEAQQAGGRMHVLLGNHEVMNLTGDLRYVSSREYLAFADAEPAGVRESALADFVAANMTDPALAEAEFDRLHPPGYFGHRAAFSPDGYYGGWLLGLPLLIVIDRTAFTHGGLPPLVASEGLEQVNATLTSELEQFVRLWHELMALGVVKANGDAHKAASRLERQLATVATPPEHAEMINEFVRLSRSDIFDADGPLWYRGSALCHPVLETGVIAAALDRLGAGRVVVGHTVTRDYRVDRRLDDRVIVMDTGMLNDFYGGVPAILTIDNGTANVTYAGEHSKALLPAGDELQRILANNEVSSFDSETGVVELAGGVQARFVPRPDHARELAAYRLDRMLGLGLVPVTVQRRIGSNRGALSARPPGYIDEKERSESNRPVTPVCARGNPFNLMYAFDALTMNEGRTRAGMLYHGPAMSLAITGFARAFGSGTGLPGYLQQAEVALPAELARRLETLDAAGLETELGKLISKRQRKAILTRRDEILATWPRTP
ncbi:MAG: metallophosphoesterase [Gammaproteobacteria bacterium]|nr:metallophosphoesterase [Gammaproteobacteria bacterium]NNM19753.1 hypothetical protein [Gammaproteobacteria bacterium]